MRTYHHICRSSPVCSRYRDWCRTCRTYRGLLCHPMFHYSPACSLFRGQRHIFRTYLFGRCRVVHLHSPDTWCCRHHKCRTYQPLYHCVVRRRNHYTRSHLRHTCHRHQVWCARPICRGSLFDSHLNSLHRTCHSGQTCLRV